MSNPYTESWLPVALAADALRNQADTIADELNASIDRTKAFRAKMKAREAEKSAMCDCGHAAGQVCFCGQASGMSVAEWMRLISTPCWRGLQNGGWDVT